MRSVSRSIAVVLLLALTVPALAKEQGVLDEVASQLENGANWIIELMARLGLPPGDEDEESGRLSPPPGDGSRIGLPPGDEAKRSGVTVFSRFGTPPGEE